MKVEQAADVLQALGTPIKLQIYLTLVRAGHKGLSVKQVHRKLGIPASTLSHHLHRLKIVELVTQERRGTMLICRANYPVAENLWSFLRDECCVDERSTLAWSERAASRPPPIGLVARLRTELQNDESFGGD
jgi:ArsR family transcriptional regulator, arsenate/arsenite/antimonite-responsive transcriptional repressor